MNINAEPISFNFSQLKNNQIMIVNDSVMGGRSESKFNINDNIINFSGDVSMKNNGGFASLRMLWPFQEAKGYNKIQLKLKGDGKSYQFRLRTNRGYDGAAYVYEFKTIKDKSTVIDMDIEKFVPGFRGRTLRNMPQLKLEDVQQMGILIANEQVGKFTIEIDSIVLLNQ
jgi:hypothetical protein